MLAVIPTTTTTAPTPTTTATSTTNPPTTSTTTTPYTSTPSTTTYTNPENCYCTCNCPKSNLCDVSTTTKTLSKNRK